VAGVRRKIDDLGRVVIPASIRRDLGMEAGEEVDVAMQDGRCVLSPVADTCVFCGAGRHLEAFRERRVCWSCMAAVRALDRERTGEEANPFGF
jgi:transcriptional pleiotropic regulator of transition state genes